MSTETPFALVRAGIERLRTSLLVRLLATAFLVLLLQIPISLIDRTIDERRATRFEALESVTSTFGGPQTLLGPMLAVPTIERLQDAEGRVRDVRVMRYLAPEALEVTGQAATEVRRRGIFDVPLFVASLKLRGHFKVTDALVATPSARPVLWKEAEICIGVGDPRAIRDAPAARFGGAELPFEPGPGSCNFIGAGIHARLPSKPGETVPFEIALSLGGSGRLAFVPVGSETSVQVAAPWADPSFDGAFLPRTREVTASGFSARWRVLHLGRNFPVAFDRGEVPNERFTESAFGVSFLSPVDAYRTTERAVKYQLLFLGLTATLFVLFELLVGVRVHPVQYLLVGLALCLFYLLLLSLSEHVGFAVAYGVAAGAITGLIGFYGSFVLGRRRRAIALAALIACLYAFLFVLLQIHDYALLVGSIGLFVVLATIMVLTRRIDWYGRPAPVAPLATTP